MSLLRKISPLTITSIANPKDNVLHLDGSKF